MPRRTPLPLLLLPFLLAAADEPATAAATATAAEVQTAPATAPAAAATAAATASAPAVRTITQVRVIEQPAPATPARWPWFAAGAVAGVALGVALGALARRRRRPG